MAGNSRPQPARIFAGQHAYPPWGGFLKILLSTKRKKTKDSETPENH